MPQGRPSNSPTVPSHSNLTSARNTIAIDDATTTADTGIHNQALGSPNQYCERDNIARELAGIAWERARIALERITIACDRMDVAHQRMNLAHRLMNIARLRQSITLELEAHGYMSSARELMGTAYEHMDIGRELLAQAVEWLNQLVARGHSDAVRAAFSELDAEQQAIPGTTSATNNEGSSSAGSFDDPAREEQAHSPDR
ncbi:uncharacterized protein LOC62_03G004348 [Vanrija pseudolonga]|uniref:Uncharacterized protein n=1 Tax=Vanrija pseudolonga TaxID=143232 RepID=A0AAF1BK98_9TREE|nr:hypothetical protein LOC62_03G004348 [Vanrija pseudolonga]